MDSVFLAMNGVVPHYRDALRMSPTLRLALCVSTRRLRGDPGHWSWFDREWIGPAK